MRTNDTVAGEPAAPLSCQAGEFRLTRGIRYLNCAYAAPLLRAVEQATQEALRRWRAPERLVAEAFFDGAERVRALFAQLIGARDGERIAIVPGTSYGIALAARNVAVGRGSNVVIADEQFPSNVYAWQRLCHRHGAELRTVRRPAGSGWNDRLLDTIDRHTAVVALGTVDWTDGTLFDLEAIGARAREVGAAYILDGIQSLGALPFDVPRIQPDLLVCSSYKWLLGPMGVGLCYVGERFADAEPLEETWLGRRDSERFATLTDYASTYQPGARRFDTAGRAHFVLLPMLAAALERLLEWQPARVQAYCAELARPALAELAAVGIEVAAADRHAMHLFAVRPPAGVPTASLRASLTRHRIHISMRTGKIRVSPNVYNTAADLEALVSVLQAAGRRRRRLRDLASPTRS